MISSCWWCIFYEWAFNKVNLHWNCQFSHMCSTFFYYPLSSNSSHCSSYLNLLKNYCLYTYQIQIICFPSPLFIKVFQKLPLYQNVPKMAICLPKANWTHFWTAAFLGKQWIWDIFVSTCPLLIIIVLVLTMRLKIKPLFNISPLTLSTCLDWFENMFYVFLEIDCHLN